MSAYRTMWGLLTPGRAIFLSALSIFALSLNSVWSADHPTALLELSFALWAHHSVVLGKVGQFQPQSVDDFVYKGSYYSALAPGASVLALPFVGVGFLLDGRFTLYGDAMLLSELFVSVCNAAAAYLVFKLGSTYFRLGTAAFLALAFAFSTTSWPFATFFFESDVSAMLDLLAVSLALRMARGGSPRLGLAVACGTALGAALTVDYINALLVPVVSVFLLYTFRRELAGFATSFVGLIASSAAGVVLLALYDQAAFGSPLVTSQQAYQQSSLLGAFSYPILAGLYVDLFSPLRGVFVYCPILILGVVGSYQMGKKSGLRLEWLLLSACFLSILIPYAMWYDVAGGEGFGSRFMIPAIPFLLLPSGFAIEGGGRPFAGLASLLYAVGVFFNGVAAITTSIPQVEALSHFPFVTQVLPRFLSGNLDAWWWRASAGLWWAPAALVLGAALAAPAVAWAKSS